jgi:molybdate transport system substrate-binding protein
MLLRRMPLLLLSLLCLLPAARAETLHIAAASDLVYCLDALDKAFVAAHPDADLKVAVGSSGNFFAQIQQGAPFDVYLSADMKYPQALIDAGLAEKDSLTLYAVGRLALWTRNEKLTLNSLSVLQRPEVRRIAIANPEHAPYGRAARTALEKAGLWKGVEKKIVLGENIAQTAQFVDTGNADIGVVAWSLLKAPQMEGRGRHYLLPLDSFPRLQQGAVLTRKGSRSALAQRYIEFLRSPAARAIFDRYGFLLPTVP